LVRHRREALALLLRQPAADLDLVLKPLAFAHAAGSGWAEPAVPLPRDVLTFAAGGDYILLDLTTGGLYELNRVMVEVFEALACRVPEADAVDYFTAAYGLRRDEAAGSLHQAAGILRDLFTPPAAPASAA
jgi:hypothetical protein